MSRSEYVPGIGSGTAKCPYDPLDNSTAVYVENGNPGGFPALVSRFLNYIGPTAYWIKQLDFASQENMKF